MELKPFERNRLLIFLQATDLDKTNPVRLEYINMSIYKNITLLLVLYICFKKNKPSYFQKVLTQYISHGTTQLEYKY